MSKMQQDLEQDLQDEASVVQDRPILHYGDQAIASYSKVCRSRSPDFDLLGSGEPERQKENEPLSL